MLTRDRSRHLGLWLSGVLLLTGAALLPSSTSAADDVPATTAKRPNVLIIIADDLGWTDLSTGNTTGGHGSRYYQTPQIDRLAAAGMSFTSAYAFQNCQPSRASLMTGQYAPHDGVYNVQSLSRNIKGRVVPLEPPSQETRINPNAITIAKTLQTAGYITAHVGKFHVSPNPQAITETYGFNYDYGGGAAGDGGPAGYFAFKGPLRGWHFRNMSKTMDPYAAPYTADYIARNLQPYVHGNDPKSLVGTPKHLTDADADAAVDFIEHHETGADKDKPFFMSVAFNAVHVQVRARPDLAAKYADLKSSDPRHTKPGYAALIEGMDQAVGRIMARLDDPNGDGDKSDSIANNTLVFFISDNGGFLGSTVNSPLRGGKGMFSEGGLRIPMIARYPGVIKPGSITSSLAHVTDLYPTAAAFAGATLPSPDKHILDGYSLSGVLSGKTTASNRNAIYWHFPGYLDTRAVPCSTIIKDVAGDKRYKILYFYEDHHYELYNLTDDIGETKNLLDGPKPPTGHTRVIAENLRDDLIGWLDRVHPSYPTDHATGKLVPPPVALDQAHYGGPRFEGTTHEDTGD